MIFNVNNIVKNKMHSDAKRFTPGTYYENKRFISLIPLMLADEQNFLILETGGGKFLESIEFVKELNLALAILSGLISLFVLFAVVYENRFALPSQEGQEQYKSRRGADSGFRRFTASSKTTTGM